MLVFGHYNNAKTCEDRRDHGHAPTDINDSHVMCNVCATTRVESTDFAPFLIRIGQTNACLWFMACASEHSLEFLHSRSDCIAHICIEPDIMLFALRQQHRIRTLKSVKR